MIKFYLARILQMRITFAMPFKLQIKPVVRFWAVLYISILKSRLPCLVGDLPLGLHMAGGRRFYNIFNIYVENFAKCRGERCVQFKRQFAIFALKCVLLCKKVILV